MDSIDHIAISVADIDRALKWYMRRFSAKIVYQDDTWAMIEFANVKLALVVEEQHPPHIALSSNYQYPQGKYKTHRDGSVSCYLKDVDDNVLELMK